MVDLVGSLKDDISDFGLKFMEGWWRSFHLGQGDDNIFGEVFELFFGILKILTRIWILRIKGFIKIFKWVDVGGEAIFEDG